MMRDEPIIGRARIKTGAPYAQDMQLYHWNGDDILFDVHEFEPGRVILTAPNHGGDPYGNGAICVLETDLVFVERVTPSDTRKTEELI